MLYTNVRDRIFDAPGTWTLTQCTTCGLVWLDPIPVVEDIPKLYTRYYTHTTTNPTFGYSQSIEAAFRRATYFAALISLGYTDTPMRRQERVAGTLMGLIGPLREVAAGSLIWLQVGNRGKLLDIGSGSGEFLAKMRTVGWDVQGVETDAHAVQAARTQYGIDNYQGTVEEAHFPDDTFDAITLNHVIEHLYDPIATLHECTRILKPGGRLVIMTPNTASLGRRRFGKHWLAWDPPRHLHLFSESTLARGTRRAGLQVVQMRTSARTAAVQWRASEFIRRRKEYPGETRPLRDLLPRMWVALIQLVEHGLCRFMPVGEELVMVASKPGRISE